MHTNIQFRVLLTKSAFTTYIVLHFTCYTKQLPQTVSQVHIYGSTILFNSFMVYQLGITIEQCPSLLFSLLMSIYIVSKFLLLNYIPGNTPTDIFSYVYVLLYLLLTVYENLTPSSEKKYDQFTMISTVTLLLSTDIMDFLRFFFFFKLF